MLFELFNPFSLDQLRLKKDDRAWDSTVLVFAGNIYKFKYDIFSQLPFHVSCSSRPFDSIYGLSVHEVAAYFVVLVGRQADIDRVLSDDFSLLQAHLVAYPATCPQCRGALLPITIECGGPRWNSICNKCSSVYHVEMGILFVYDLKTRSFVPVDSEAVPRSTPPGLPSPADASEPESPDPEPKTWRQLPPLF